ncbi:MAG: adenylosuccinate synthetase, partial [Clostridia bacterium]|nr:adenylosuccinate synthetase [Clostridia bacterium]
LGYLDEIKVCVGYEIDGEITEDFPVTPRLNRAKPVYKVFPGWKCDIRGMTDYNALPQQVKDYVNFIEQFIETPIKMVSTGPKREDIAYR